jgi:acetolactate synthase-1/2/3 large subunit
VRHEQGAGHAAEGYARSTGKPGVVLVTSGPGATNMVTPLTDALMDSIPLVCITGAGADPSDRQRTPSRNATRSASRGPHQAQLPRARRQRPRQRVLHEAFHIATTGRPGPVWSICRRTCSSRHGTYHPPRKSDVHISYTPRVKGDATQIRKAVVD